MGHIQRKIKKGLNINIQISFQNSIKLNREHIALRLILKIPRLFYPNFALSKFLYKLSCRNWVSCENILQNFDFCTVSILNCIRDKVEYTSTRLSVAPRGKQWRETLSCMNCVPLVEMQVRGQLHAPAHIRVVVKT